jgi:hypothetical protein
MYRQYLSLDDARQCDMLAPLHTGPIGSKVGVTCEVTVTVSCAVVAQGTT